MIVASGSALIAACGGGGTDGGATPAAGAASTITLGNAISNGAGSGSVAGTNIGAGNTVTTLAATLAFANNGPTIPTLANSGVGALTGIAAAADDWVQCAAEGELCSVSAPVTTAASAAAPVQVRYGVPGKYAYAIVSESVPCTNAAFTDPASGAFKICSYKPLTNGQADGAVVQRPASGRTLQVGPGKTYARPCLALAAAADGDVVEIDAAGTYVGDVCAFGANDLTIRGVNGRPKIDAGGQNAWGKGTWVVTGRGTLIDNVEMSGAAVADRNGAAIRLDGVHLTLRNSFIHDNENGILTSNDGASNIVVENTEFGHNGSGVGNTHNLYVGDVASLIFRFNFSHDAVVGHDLKSRAHVNTISYNRFSSLRPGETGSTAAGEPSYEIDLPNAGTAYVIGNVIEQPAQNQNSNMLAYGMEGASNLGQSLYVANNTFINDSANGMFVIIGSDVKNPALLQNNLFVGSGSITSQSAAVQLGNFHADASAFRNLAAYDLVLTSSAGFTGTVVPGMSNTGVPLSPRFEYIAVAGSRVRPAATPVMPGAYGM